MKAFWNRVLIFTLIFTLVQPIFPAFERVVDGSGHFAGGSGTEEDPYQIETAEQLSNIRAHLDNKHFILIDDIDLSEYGNWEPIGHGSNHFRGTFDGNGYTISNLTIDGAIEFGLFRSTSSAIIQNVQLINVDIKGGGNGGGLIGSMNTQSQVNNSYVTGKVTAQGTHVGGLVGSLNSGSTITRSHTNVSVTNMSSSTDNYTGGLVGSSMFNGTISNSYTTGTTSGRRSVGGLAGQVGNSNTIIDSYSTGDVIGGNDAGGIIGVVIAGSSTLIINSYAIGAVSGGNEGGLIGRLHLIRETFDIQNSYWNTITTGMTSSPGGGEGKTTDEMKERDTFDGWNFEETWIINEGQTYPFHQWDGSGTEDVPFIIYTPLELDVVRHVADQNYHFQLGRDIDLSGYENWEPIGDSDNPFRGLIDGRGNTISGLTIKQATQDYAGLFGYVSFAEIKKINIENIIILGEDHIIGGVAGRAVNSKINNVSVSGSMIGETIGGLVGSLETTEISQSSTTGDISGHLYVGGLVGQYVSQNTIGNSYSTATVNGNENASVAGLVGYVINSHNQIYNSYAAGKVTGGNNSGGLVGEIGDPIIIQNTYWDKETTQQDSSANGLGEGKTTSEMHQQSTFEGWNFDDTWFMVNNRTYPIFYSSESQDPTLQLDSLATRHVTHDNDESILMTSRLVNIK